MLRPSTWYVLESSPSSSHGYDVHDPPDVGTTWHTASSLNSFTSNDVRPSPPVCA